MSAPKDPLRLREASDTDASLRAMLEAARDDLPDAARLARLRARLPSPPPEAPRAPAPRGVRWIGVASLVALLLGAYALRTARPLEPRSAPVVTAAHATVAPHPTPLAEAPATPHEGAPASPVASPPPVVPRPVAPRPVAAGPVVRRLGHAPAPSQAAPRPSATTETPLAPPTSCDPGEQVARLARAQQRLRAGDARDVVAHCTRDSADCPDGPLAEERERLWIEALVALDRDDEARARWLQFERRFPASAYRERLRVVWAREHPEGPR